jgi:hypothetical protein
LHRRTQCHRRRRARHGKHASRRRRASRCYNLESPSDGETVNRTATVTEVRGQVVGW